MLVSLALAAEQGAEGAGHQAFYAAPEFWVAISFVIFVALTAKVAWRAITTALDKKIETIKTSVSEAESLREEAQDLLAGYTRKRAEAEKEIEDILAQAREEATLMRARLTSELEATLGRRAQMATDRIAQAESEALQEVRRLTADMALAAAQALMVDAVKGDKGAGLIDAAIAELPENLNH